ncbi:amino acid permease C-terminal domain-containing protein [Nocardia sp. CA-120079]|uniref:amino acid permease C-terminal domain-containing protein n=1 Tax=Nocardia sp. CA-120079 TaxID=3239974 RepID=UPI003D966C22
MNIGALSAFAVVCVGVLVLRKLEPNRERPFRTPLVPLVPILALIGCVLLATTLDGLTWVCFAVWVLGGSAVYLGYGRKRSTIAAPTITNSTVSAER